MKCLWRILHSKANQAPFGLAFLLLNEGRSFVRFQVCLLLWIAIHRECTCLCAYSRLIALIETCSLFCHRKFTKFLVSFVARGELVTTCLKPSIIILLVHQPWALSRWSTSFSGPIQPKPRPAMLMVGSCLLLTFKIDIYWFGFDFLAPISGLQNVGNNCFTNAIIQALANSESMSSWLADANRRIDGKGKLISTLSTLVTCKIFFGLLSLFLTWISFPPRY